MHQDDPDPSFDDDSLSPKDRVVASLMAILAGLPPEKREGALLTFLKPIIEHLSTTDLNLLTEEIRTSDLPQDHPTLIAVLDMIEGQIALRDMHDEDDE